VNDFLALLQVLYADESSISTAYRRESKDNPKLEPPISDLDRIQSLWQSIFTARELVTTADSVKARIPDGAEYAASEMSDGERAAFYLIGQCICAPENALVIVDEPEVHLHRSIQATLWDGIENLRPDCTFVYLTHDLEFAASRSLATKICLTDYDGTNWTWKEVEQVESLSEDVLLDIAGSRKNILFVEGERTSLDLEIYRIVYSDHYIKPAGGCKSVINAVKGVRGSKQLHRLHAQGIVDLDQLNPDSVATLQESHIHALDVSEVENLLLIEPLLLAAANHMGKGVAEVELVKQSIFELLQGVDTKIAAQIAHAQVCAKMMSGLGAPQSEAELKAAFDTYSKAIDIPAIYQIAELSIQEALTNEDYHAALKLLNLKAVGIKKAATHLGFKDHESYRIVVLKLLRENKDGCTDTIRQMMPSFE